MLIQCMPSRLQTSYAYTCPPRSNIATSFPSRHLVLARGGAAGPVPYVPAPSQETLGRRSRAVDGGANVQVEDVFAVGIGRTRVVVDHVSYLLRCSLRASSLDVPVVTVERWVGAASSMSANGVMSRKKGPLRRLDHTYAFGNTSPSSCTAMALGVRSFGRPSNRSSRG